jgi:Class II Aldolase and Adducin N-terminal domain/ARD/ARD' family
MKLFYLDCQTEKASVFILGQLNVTTKAITQNGSQASQLSADLCSEHRSSTPVSFKLVSGDLTIDVRDEADCWIRIVLQAGDEVTIPSNLYRRLEGAKESVIVHQDASNSNFFRFDKSSDSIALNSYHEYRELVCELCRQFFTAGWVTGTGGSISIRHGNRIYMTPSGVQKERIQPDELYVLDIDGEVLSVPQQKPGSRLPKLSDCAPLFLHAFKQRNAGAVLHSHSMCCNLVTSLFEGQYLTLREAIVLHLPSGEPIVVIVTMILKCAYIAKLNSLICR